MSEQAAEQTGGDSGSLTVEPGIAATSEAVKAPDAAAQGLASEFSLSDADKVIGAAEAAAVPLTDAKADAPAAPAVEVAAEPAKVEAAEPADILGKVIVMSPRDRGSAGHGATSRPEAGEVVFKKRRVAAFAAVAVLATAAGALGGAMATATFMRGGAQAVAVHEDEQGAIAASLSHLDADLHALKAGLEHTSKIGMSQFNKTSDRLDRLERAQAAPAAKLSETSDKSHALPVPPPVLAAAPATAPASKEVTGSIGTAPQQVAAAAAAPKNDSKIDAKPDAKAEVGRLPTVDGWVLRDVAYGGALINGRRGVYEVYAGDYIPGLGRIDAIRRQDGRWVVVTSKGLIVAR